MINDYLNQFIGYSAKQKILMDAQKYLLEEKRKILDSNPFEISLVYVTDLKSKEIKSIGGSIPKDLIMNNFGEFWAGMNRIPTQVGASITPGLVDDTNTVRVIGLNIGATSEYNNTGGGGAIGSEIAVGQGSTAAARTDFNIETNFANGGPEDTKGSTLSGGYNSSLGQVSVSRTITPTAGTGTVTESAIFFEWIFVGGVGGFLIARDIISPGVSFIIAQAITIVYTWQL